MYGKYLTNFAKNIKLGRLAERVALKLVFVVPEKAVIHRVDLFATIIYDHLFYGARILNTMSNCHCQINPAQI